MVFDDLQKKSDEYNERNDCTVKACVILCGVTYEEAHAAMKAEGRRNRCRSPNWHAHIDAIKKLGFELIEEKFPGKTMVTLERDLKRYGGGRKYLIDVRGHVAAFDGKQIVDWTKGRRHRINGVYRVKPKSAQANVVTAHAGVQVNYDAAAWLRDMPRPQGAPKKGERVTQTIGCGETYTGEVVDYLSTQFIIRTESGDRVVSVGDDWEKV